MKYNVEEINNDGMQRIISIKYDGDITKLNVNELLDSVAKEIFNDKNLLNEFFANDVDQDYVEILEQIGEVEKDNEYINLSNYDYIDTSEVLDKDVKEIINLIHEPFIRACLETFAENIEECISEESQMIYL